ncbi:CRISPR-associated endonuclease Cas2 [uncultured Mailhella sp.]|uniref:CRISPR-associated endonuclease Cas2 n=1 Tax=uncultured Mailhella sp. TaxID=1981031 RepID=UPI00261AAF65|nr:CRISPR-associated endonuclease Cas2 [uncultured Mailhella sp.]
MHTVIAYDVCSNKNRTRIFHILRDLGVNSQRSVFECELTLEETRSLILRLEEYLDPKKDSLLVYPLCRRCACGVRILGQGLSLVRTDWEVV